MSLDDFMEGIHILQNNYNQKFSKDKLKLFYENLQDMPRDKYINNIKELIKTSQFVPSIAQIRSETISKQYNNFEQRDYSGVDFNKLFFTNE